MKTIFGLAIALALCAVVCPTVIRLFDNVQAVLDKFVVVQ